MDSYDVVVIGAGPGGYVAAIRCAQLGFKVLCVDQWHDDKGRAVLGGTCLNVGCIPSKALLDSSHHYEWMQHEAAEHGIRIAGVDLDLAAMMARKNKVVKTLTQGIVGLFRKHRIESVQGHARLAGAGRVLITTGPDSRTQEAMAKDIIIATGSSPMTLRQAPFDEQCIVSSTGALRFPEVPRRLGIIGAGVIGLELGSVWRRLGADVVLFEALDTFLPAVDEQIAAEARKVLSKQGLDIRLGSRVSATSCTAAEVEVAWKTAQGEQYQQAFDRVIVAVGRQPNSGDLGAEDVGLAVDDHGFIKVDAHNQTNLPHVFAIGDVVGGAMLAHKSSEEGVAVAERIAGQQAEVNHAAIPWVIYTWPEIAWVGQSEQAARAAGLDVRTGIFPFLASARARAQGDTTGLVKLVSDARTDQLLGVHILGPSASELVSEAVVALEFRASSEDLARTIHAHPTLAEALHEAALAVDGRAINI